jgi:hypothetical protein
MLAATSVRFLAANVVFRLQQRGDDGHAAAGLIAAASEASASSTMR